MTPKKRKILTLLQDGQARCLQNIGLECGRSIDYASSWASDAVQRLQRDGLVSYDNRVGATITEQGRAAL